VTWTIIQLIHQENRRDRRLPIVRIVLLTETVKKGKLFKKVEGVPINFMECSNLLKTKCFRNWNDESMAFVERFCNFSALLGCS